MYTIKTMNQISPSGLQRLGSEYQIDANAKDPDGIIVRSASLQETNFAPSTKAIARAGAGVNNIPIDRCSGSGIVVFNTPGANANAVKELVFAGLLLSARKIYQGIAWTKNDQAGDLDKRVEKEKKNFAGSELQGKSLGIIGLGAIGIQVANLALKFGMQVYGYDPYISIDAAWNLSRSVIRAAHEEDIYKNCDYITIHVPLNEQTKGMINRESLAKMKDGVRLLNFARGALVDEEALIQALHAGKVASYVTDFPDDRLAKEANVITIPHLGASTAEAEENCVIKAVEELKDFLTNGNILNSVNMPNVTMERVGCERIGVIHRNVPNMLAQIAETLAKNHINIANMINKSKKDYAYTLIDLDEAIAEASFNALRAIDGVIRVNVYPLVPDK